MWRLHMTLLKIQFVHGLVLRRDQHLRRIDLIMHQAFRRIGLLQQTRTGRSRLHVLLVRSVVSRRRLRMSRRRRTADVHHSTETMKTTMKTRILGKIDSSRFFEVYRICKTKALGLILDAWHFRDRPQV